MIRPASEIADSIVEDFCARSGCLKTQYIVDILIKNITAAIESSQQLGAVAAKEWPSFTESDINKIRSEEINETKKNYDWHESSDRVYYIGFKEGFRKAQELIKKGLGNETLRRH